MTDTLVLLVAFFGLAILAFAASLRVGMLVGRRLDRLIEVRASAGGPDELASPGAAAHSIATNNVATEDVGQQEDRG